MAPSLHQDGAIPVFAEHAGMRYNKRMEGRSILVLYHANCPDGFGGAYSAWKKFGDGADYIPLSYGKPLPDVIDGKEVYMIDMCFPQDVMNDLVARAASLVVLDHHEGIKDVIETMPTYIYDDKRSGASIAWAYFHPDVPLPHLLSIIEDDDLFLFHLPDTKAMMAYISVKPFTFEFWDDLALELDDPSRAESLLTKVRMYREYFDLLVAQSVERAKLVQFEGHEVYVGQSHPNKPMVSALGNALASKQGPLALVVQIRTEGIAVSIRGDGSLDVTTIAKKFGGNGHPSSAAFLVPWNAPLPWTPVPKDETPRD